MPKQKILLISTLCFAFAFSASAAYAALTFSADSITGTGGLILSPTGEPASTTFNFEGYGNDTLTTQSSISTLVNARDSGPGHYGDWHAGTSYFSTIAPTAADDDYNVYAANLIDANVSGDQTVYESYGLLSQITSSNTSAVAPTGDYITGIESQATISQPTYSATGLDGQVLFLADGSQGTGVYSAVVANNGAQITGNFGLTGVYSTISLTGGAHSNVVYNIYQSQYISGATVDTWYGLWANDLQGVATNTYYSWDDSRGVRRVKEDNTFNGVGQAIEALYNPQFTKYTPGAANYERIVLGQWDSNVAEIGTEAGGTGTLRNLKLLGAGVTLPNHVTTNSSNNDYDGTIAISSATSASHTFTTAFGSAPVCTLTPTSDPNATGRYWVTANTTTVTANVSTSGSITFNYHCIGNPN